MEAIPFNYISIYHYLEEELKHIDTPSKAQIIALKKEYYRLYHKKYNHEYRNKVHQYTLSFSKAKFKRINNRRGKLSVSKFIYEALDVALEDSSAYSVNKDVLSSIQKMLMQLIDLTSEDSKFDVMFERLEQLEAAFSKLKTK